MFPLKSLILHNHERSSLIWHFLFRLRTLRCPAPRFSSRSSSSSPLRTRSPRSTFPGTSSRAMAARRKRPSQSITTRPTSATAMTLTPTSAVSLLLRIHVSLIAAYLQVQLQQRQPCELDLRWHRLQRHRYQHRQHAHKLRQQRHFRLLLRVRHAQGRSRQG